MVPHTFVQFSQLSVCPLNICEWQSWHTSTQVSACNFWHSFNFFIPAESCREALSRVWNLPACTREAEGHLSPKPYTLGLRWDNSTTGFIPYIKLRKRSYKDKASLQAVSGFLYPFMYLQNLSKQIWLQSTLVLKRLKNFLFNKQWHLEEVAFTRVLIGHVVLHHSWA